MRILFPLIALFFIGCVFYGISAGVQAIMRKIAWFASRPEPDKPEARPDAAPSPQYLHELRQLHELHQRGALSPDEFQQFKQRLLSSISASTA